MKITLRRALVLTLAASCASAGPAQDTALVRFDDLPLLPRHRTVHQFSSHNKRGDNGDEKWNLYRDENGHAVAFDVEGPGCIRSIWATDIREDAELLFTFDGEEEPRLRIGMLDLFQGKHEQFPKPLVSYERRGHWGERPFAGNCFVPIPFARGLKIAIAGEFHFYHFLYERYPLRDRTNKLAAGVSELRAGGHPGVAGWCWRATDGRRSGGSCRVWWECTR